MPRPRSSAVLAFVLVLVAVTFAPSPTAASSSSAAGSSRVARVLIKKNDHVLQLLGGREEIIASYKVAIGPGGSGPKKREGDQVTPVGRYHVTMHQPSQYKVFLRLDYPNADDVRRFATLKNSGALPKEARIGSDIGIHGPPVAYPRELKSSLKQSDWTLGCIALDDDEISDVARLVRDGTPVDIED